MKTLLVIAFLLLLAAETNAQQLGSYGGYNPPAGSTLSPRLNYFRRDPGPVGRYLSFVRPGLQLERTLQQQQTSLTDLRGDLQAVGQQQAIAPTGAAGVFLNHGAYFGNEALFYRTRGQFSGQTRRR
ncbi:MAG: hypothetical protein HY000_24480 [Planctomycetes bacterium]|nr:hypothetical protein [Planctomycetota bacterium]